MIPFLFLFIGALVFGWFIWRKLSGPRLRLESQFLVESTISAILVKAPNDESRSVLWDELTKIEITITDDGPMMPDVFWRFYGCDDELKLVFPGGATGESELLAALQTRLPNFDNQKCIEAMGCTTNQAFLLWKRGESTS